MMLPAIYPLMPETSKSKRFEAICFKRSLWVVDLDYLSTGNIIRAAQPFVKARDKGAERGRRKLLSIFKVLRSLYFGHYSFIGKKRMRNE